MKKYCLLLLLIFILCGCNVGKKTQMVAFCEEGVLVKDKCLITESVEPKSIVCEEDGFTLNKESKKCERVVSIPANRRVGCKDEENYVLKNGACIPKNGKGPRKYKISIYSCPDSGRLNKNQCEFVDEKTPIITCDQGYEVNEEKAVCEKKTYKDPLYKKE